MRCNTTSCRSYKARSTPAYFAEAGGLTTDDDVQVSGFTVGQVKSIELDGPQVLVKFTVDEEHPAR